MKKKQCPGKPLGNKIPHKKPHSNSAKSQREEILRIFNKNPSLSTIQARDEYGIMHPGGRVMELRQMGYKIETYWTTELDSHKVPHRVGLYVYMGQKKGDKRGK